MYVIWKIEGSFSRMDLLDTEFIIINIFMIRTIWDIVLLYNICKAI